MSRSIAAGIVIVFAMFTGWWIKTKDAPWIDFHKSAAVYTPHDMQLFIVDEFTVNRECPGVAAWHYIVVLWDHTVRALSPTFMPDLRNGHHRHDIFITWSPDSEIPHGATIRSITLCSDDQVAISDGAPVRIADERPLPIEPEDLVPKARLLRSPLN